MRSLDAQLQLLLLAALLYTSGSGGLRYNLGPRLAPSLQDIVNTATEPPQINTTEEVRRPDICCWDNSPSLAPTVVLRPSHPDAVPDPTWAETLRTATWRALGEGSGRSPPWQELSVAPFPKSASRKPPPTDREVALLARGVLIRGSDDRLQFTEDCVCDKSAETAGVLATWGVRRLRHSGPNQFHRPYYELQFSASALLPTLSRPATVLPPGRQSAPVAKGIVFNLTGTRRTSLPESIQLPIVSVEGDPNNTTGDLNNTTDAPIKSPNTSTTSKSPTSPTPPISETAAAEKTTPVSLETVDLIRVPDPTLVVFESVPTESTVRPDNSSLTSTSPPTLPSTQPTTSTSPSPASLETSIYQTITPVTTPSRSSSPFRLSLLTSSTLGRLLNLTSTPPTTFRPTWRPWLRPRTKTSIVETRTTYKVFAERRPKRP